MTPHQTLSMLDDMLWDWLVDMQNSQWSSSTLVACQPDLTFKKALELAQVQKGGAIAVAPTSVTSPIHAIS